MLLQAPPTVGGASALADAGALTIVLFLGALLIFAFYKRIIVWGSTCEKLLENEQAKTEAQRERADEEKAGRMEAERTTIRMAQDFSDHLRVIFQEFRSQR